MSIRGATWMVLPVLLCTSCQTQRAPEAPGDAASASSAPAATESTATNTAPASASESGNGVTLPQLEELPSESFHLSQDRVVAPAALIEASGSLWVQDHRGSLLTKVDPDSGAIQAQAHTGLLGCGDLNFGGNAIWWTGCGEKPGLVKVDADTMDVTLQRSLPGLDPAFLDDELWIATEEYVGSREVSLSRMPLTGDEEARLVPVPGLTDSGSGVVAIAGSIWVGDQPNGIVYQVDPETEEVMAAIPVPIKLSMSYLIEHDGAPWIYDAWHGRLLRVDPQDLDIELLDVVLDRPREYFGVAASTSPDGEGLMWVRNGDAEMWLLDTRTEEVLRRVAVDAAGGGGDVQQVGHALWVSGFANGTVQRIDL